MSRLLFRFYDVNRGAVTINGIDVRDITQASLRQPILALSLKTRCFSTIAFCTTSLTVIPTRPRRHYQAAKAASIHDFVLGLPEGYQTQVGERGLKLSGGEKQRVAIARTLLKNPPILILDEATSALDTRTERAIQEELKQIAQHRTTLIIAHRLSTIVDADEIIVLDHGRVLEQGSHRDLVLQGGRYAQMWNLQQAGRTKIT